ncbi:MAG: molecular chaperone [Sphingomonas sanxanigenens]|uniref:Molecular chaperone n=1 Tax=Sphingomonas sanxanigenens TaxID=397260 RepID=A0A2W5C1F0_9SPHN|nr:MAG: molecular chaperone [Sphingomonas sanxanigenens]
MARLFTIRALLIAAAIGNTPPATAQSGPVLIWPIDPVIANKERATALWLENPGSSPIQFQLRIFAWSQTAFDEHLAPQSDIVATPPIVRIAPGQRQLVRLTKTQSASPPGERAYRVIIDELPPAAEQSASGARIQFRMRYAIPLFSYGPGLSPPDASGPSRAEPRLNCAIVTSNGQRFIEIRNEGAGHARLVDAGFSNDREPLARGLLGYVLPGASMRWPLSSSSGSGVLRFAVNGQPQQSCAPQAGNAP